MIYISKIYNNTLSKFSKTKTKVTKIYKKISIYG